MNVVTGFASPLQRWLNRHAYLWSVAIVAVVTILVWLLHQQAVFPQFSITPFYLVGVLLCAITVGRWPAMLCAVLGFVAFKFFFVAPIYTLTVDDAEDTARMLVFLTTAFLGGGMGVWVREQAAAAHRRADEAAALYDLSQAISAELQFRAIAPLIVETTARLLRSPASELLLVEPDGVLARCARAGTWPAAAAVAEASLRSGDETLGVLRVAAPNTSPIEGAHRSRLLETLANQAALALARSRLAEEAARAGALAESDRLKSTLLSAVSHDFRTPLASISAAAEELAADDVAWSPEAIGEFAHVIRAETKRLNRLVTSLLDLTRIEAGVLHPQCGWYDVAEIVYAVLQRFATELTNRPVELNIPDDLPLVPVDYVQIEQVIWNVLENAIKYAPAGSALAIGVAVEPGALIVGIGDRGPGIAPQERERVFETFYRLPRGTHDQIPGTGIGLAICKGLVEAHGGHISLCGREGGGTLVEISLPLVKQEVLIEAEVA